jgi:large subunit ribosomal protein L17
MKHKIKGRKFGRRSEHRTSMFMNLVKSLITHKRICTTLPKAKDLKPIAEKIITLSKDNSLSSRKKAISFMKGNCQEVNELFTNIAAKVKDRNGGYLRIIKSGYRQGDNAPLAYIEFVD